MPTRIVRFVPVAFGFGPVGKALHIARQVRQRAGRSLSLDLVAPSAFAAIAEDGLFEQVGEVATRRADLVVSVMSQRGATEAVDESTTVFLVDSLAWMWDRPVFGSLAYDRYFVQVLPFLEALRSAPTGAGATPIPPIVGPLIRFDRGPDRRGVVVSVSGVESTTTSLEEGRLWWLEYCASGLEELAFDPTFVARHELRLFGNEEVLRARTSPRLQRHRASTHQRAFLDAVSHASCVIAPPGLTTLIETLRLGTPLRLLPPQNYSQLRISHALAAVPIPALRWPSLALDWLARATVPEAVGVELINATIAARVAGGERLTGSALAQLVADPAGALSDAEVDELIGKGDGADIIADAICGRLL